MIKWNYVHYILIVSCMEEYICQEYCIISSITFTTIPTYFLWSFPTNPSAPGGKHINHSSYIDKHSDMFDDRGNQYETMRMQLHIPHSD